MKTTTLALLVRGEKILLGCKRGNPEIGDGKLNGPGGKMEDVDRTLLDCLVRETEEELRVTIDPRASEKVAVLYCYASERAFMKVHVFRVTWWEGAPRETTSMVPEWHTLGRLPYERMHEADRHWLERAARGEKFRAMIHYEAPGEGFRHIEFHPFSDD